MLPFLQFLVRHNARHCLYACDLSPIEPTVFPNRQIWKINRRIHADFDMPSIRRNHNQIVIDSNQWKLLLQHIEFQCACVEIQCGILSFSFLTDIHVCKERYRSQKSQMQKGNSFAGRGEVSARNNIQYMRHS